MTARSTSPTNAAVSSRSTPAGREQLPGPVIGFRDGSGSDARFRRLAGMAAAEAGGSSSPTRATRCVRAVTAVARSSARCPGRRCAAPRFDEEAFARTPLLWPVSPMDGPHEIAGTIGEARGAAGGERFHAGVDVRIEEGTPVRAVRDGTVMSPVSTGEFGTLNEWLRLGSVSYVHVRAGRERKRRCRHRAGLRRHLRRRGKAGAGSRAPRHALRHRRRHRHRQPVQPRAPERRVAGRGSEPAAAPPVAVQRHHRADDRGPRRALLQAKTGRPFHGSAARRRRVSGRVRIVVDAWDQADGNRPNRRLGLYALGYEVLSPDGTPRAGIRSERPTARLRSAGGAARCRRGSSMRPAAAFLSMAGGARGFSMS